MQLASDKCPRWKVSYEKLGDGWASLPCVWGVPKKCEYPDNGATWSVWTA